MLNSYDDFYRQAQVLCRRHGTIIICDEVQAGLGWTGREDFEKERGEEQSKPLGL